MKRHILFHKPFEVLCQFTDRSGRATLKDYIPIAGVYSVGRLDYRSEGLLFLTDDIPMIRALNCKENKLEKTYWVQVEGILIESALLSLNERIVIPSLQTSPAKARAIPIPDVNPRIKAVRDYHPTSWLELKLQEGKKHQVRRMTAAVGFPTLRLLRVAIGNLKLGNLQPGEWRELINSEIVELRKLLDK